jgi:dipeptidase
MNKILIIVFVLQFFIPAFSQVRMQQADRECFMILVGKNASADGSVLLAHNNDLSGVEPSHFVKYPGESHSSTDSVSFPSGLKIPQADSTCAWMTLKIFEGYAEGDAVAINEHGVAIAGGVALKPDRNSRAAIADPLVKNGLTGGIRYIALQRSKTARQCVKILGDFYNEYGVTYPSGIGIADTNEIWYIESGGGHSWAAVRIPDSCYWPQANGYRIGQVDAGDTLNYYSSPGLPEFCIANNLWDPATGPFDFADAFGGGRKERNEKPFYDTRRIWRCIDLLNPSMGFEPGRDEYPSFLVPENKILLTDCFGILRDRYQGSAFANSVDDTGENGERPIASWNAVHTDVISLAPGLPVGNSAVMWVGIGPPQVTTYVPFCFGAGLMLPAYSETGYQPDSSAFWVFRKLADKARGNKKLLKKISKKQKKMEKEFILEVNKMIYQAEEDPLYANGLHAFSWDLLSIYAASQSIDNAQRLIRKY